MNELYRAMNAMAFVNAMVELRLMYNEHIEIANGQGYTESQRYEAQQITEGGFYKFIGRHLEMGMGGE